MDLFDTSFVELWQYFHESKVKYILVGGLATNLHGFQRFTGDVDIYIEDSIENRKRLRTAYKNYSNIDFEFERVQFVPGWIDFPLNNGVRLDIMTSMAGVDLSFDDCFKEVRFCEVGNVQLPVLHINHLIANKKAVARPKDLIDVLHLEKIKMLLDNSEAS